MNTETLKLNIVQQILNLSDTRILEQVKELLGSETIVGYRTDGTPITKNQFVAEMDEQQERIKKGEAQFYTTEEVRKKILDANSLGR